mgnify:CR=1 FL=1
MPNPTPSAVYVDELLTDISVAYVQSSTNYVASRFAPTVEVQKQSGIVPQYSRADFLRSEMQKRAAGSGYARVGYRTDNTLTYLCEEFGAEHPIDDAVRANASGSYDADRDATIYLTQQGLLKMEKEWAAACFSTGVWTGTSDAGDLVSGTDFTAWSNAASTPIEDIHDANFRMQRGTGFLANKLTVGLQSWYDLKNHPDIVDRYKHTSAESITTDMVARLLDLDEVLVASAVENTAGEGASHSGAHIVTADRAVLSFTPDSPSLMQPSAAYTVAWNGLLGSNSGMVVERYREDAINSDIIRVRGAWDHKVIAPVLGAMFLNCSTKI